MVDHSSSSQNGRKTYIRRFLLTRSRIHAGLMIKSRMHIHALSSMEKHVHVGKLIFGSVVFGPMVLELGTVSEILNPGIGSLVLVCTRILVDADILD